MNASPPSFLMIDSRISEKASDFYQINRVLSIATAFSLLNLPIPGCFSPNGTE